MTTTSYNWQWFRNEIRRCSDAAESECLIFLNLVEQCDKVVSQMVSRPMSYASDRPQDYVVPILATRAFRLAISSLQIALSGYADSTPNLNRTVFEIAIRLLDISTDPIASSLAYLMQGAKEEISTMEVELRYRKETGLTTLNLPVNLERMREYLKQLQELCQKKGIDPEDACKKHGKLNV
jgi:hypothetical protein